MDVVHLSHRERGSERVKRSRCNTRNHIRSLEELATSPATGKPSQCVCSSCSVHDVQGVEKRLPDLMTPDDRAPGATGILLYLCSRLCM